MKRNLIVALLCLVTLSGCELPSSLSSETTSEAASSSADVFLLTVTFDTRGGNAIASERVAEGTLVNRPEDPARTGYTFIGWFLEDLVTPWDFDADPVTADTTIYADWSLNEYSLSFESNGGSYVAPITAYYGDAIPNTTPTRFAYTFSGWYLEDTLTTPVILSDVMPAVSGTLYAKWDVEAFNLPILMIDLGVDITAVNREDYVRAGISLSNVASSFSFNDIGADFRGRGNGSWENYDQKGYRIKFDNKIPLFGEASSRHWVLVPGANDFGSMRSNAAFGITQKILDKIEYTSSFHIVEVYVNGNYHGVYSVLEQVRVADDRVDIASDFGVLDTGYLIEYDAYAEGVNGIDYFPISGLKYDFSMKSPDPDDYAEETTETIYRSQVTYIKNYMQQLISAILQRNYTTITSLVDIDSVVDMYIIHELFKNTDTGWSSFYMYKKPSGKVFFGPIWDFDYTAGLSRGDSSTTGLYVSDTVQRYSNFTASEIYINLMKITTFKNLVKARYLAIHSQIAPEINDLFTATKLYAQSYARDAVRWTWHADWLNEQNDAKQWLLSRDTWLYSWAGGN